MYGSLNISHDLILESDKWVAEFEIEGDRGICSGRISSMIGDGKNFQDNISFFSKSSRESIHIDKKLDGRWFSDAFYWPYLFLDKCN